MVKELLGHKNVVTTQEYLGVSYSKLKKGCDQISVSRLNTSEVLYNSLAEDVGIISMLCWKSTKYTPIPLMMSIPLTI